MESVVIIAFLILVAVVSIFSRRRRGPVADIERKAFNRISAKHFDYVVCDAATLDVRYVVELNDKSHDKPARVERDRFLQEVCRSAGVPLFTFRVQRSYSLPDVTEVLSEAA